MGGGGPLAWPLLTFADARLEARRHFRNGMSLSAGASSTAASPSCERPTPSSRTRSPVQHRARVPGRRQGRRRAGVLPPLPRVQSAGRRAGPGDARAARGGHSAEGQPSGPRAAAGRASSEDGVASSPGAGAGRRWTPRRSSGSTR